MENNAPNFIAAAGNAWDTLAALALAYSFSVIGAIIILVVGWLLAGLAQRWSYRAMGAVGHVDETIRAFISAVLRYVILLFVGVTVLSQFGVQTTSIIAALGAAGLAVGLALQGTLQNIAAGLMLLFLRPFRVGEYIETEEVAGTVKDVGLFATELQSFDGLYILSPNSSLWGTPVRNFSRNPNRRADIVFGIGYDDDLDLARRTLLDLANGDPRVLKEPAPLVLVSELAASTVNLNLRYWTARGDHEKTKSDLSAKGKHRFDELGIDMPVPQQEIRYIPASEPGENQPADKKSEGLLLPPLKDQED